ncbi:MAG: asparagine synthase (glutamine-hydrolyzing) [Acidobacteria bacterium]|nr:asparagine synthase (glutamine-hydrolyzing) [Acidobacteriota bacterium]MBI3657729.1 asparagine synthase (glutamine-hydrolyzing) [Acidobacteriota bacterium]
MCGIVGKLNLDGRPVNPELLVAMARMVAHRGPDDEGLFCRGPVGLAHRRLSIVDLSPAGHQPMSNEDGQLWITYNGEIYNFPELRQSLIQKGYRFRSGTDTEVILNLYAEYGVECLAYLRGFFAFAVWDARQRRLFAARDRVGKKPFFYYHNSETFLFASEIKSILQDPDVRSRPDFNAIHNYLTYQYVPSPWSAFAGIRKLPPAHYLLLENGHVKIERYWRLDYSCKVRLSEKAAAEALLEHLREAVRLRMISDVPLGAFLSGGIDSSAIVALMSEISHGPVKTFSIGFEEAPYNELAYARMVAQRFHTDHQEFVVKPQAVEVLPQIVWHYNEPFADSSAIPTYYLAQMTRRAVTVALNGDGGDESFAGYDRYAAAQLAHYYDRVPAALRKTVERVLLSILPEGRPSRSWVGRARRFLAALCRAPACRYGRWIAHFNADHKDELYSPDFKAQVSGWDADAVIERLFKVSTAPDILEVILDTDVQTYLPDDLLVKVDVATMAHSLEARSPFLDHVLMEFAASLPADFKIRHLSKKYILKKALSGLLPREILHRPKMGFGVPINDWFRTDLKGMTYDVLLSKTARSRGYFNPQFIQRMIDEHVTGARQWHYQLWNLLLLELWHRAFIDTAAGPSTSARSADES